MVNSNSQWFLRDLIFTTSELRCSRWIISYPLSNNDRCESGGLKYNPGTAACRDTSSRIGRFDHLRASECDSFVWTREVSTEIGSLIHSRRSSEIILDTAGFKPMAFARKVTADSSRVTRAPAMGLPLISCLLHCQRLGIIPWCFITNTTWHFFV